MGQPGLTAERFVPHPFSRTPGARLYRTGDRVKRLPSGELEFLGRLDGQVKLRGMRVELGEVEAALMALPVIREAAAVMDESVPGLPRLVAYVVARSEQSVDPAGLRAALKTHLPEHMVPTAFIPLGALPLGATGKVDRKALGSQARVPTPIQGRFSAPSDPLEEQLSVLWSRVLGAERIGVHDQFFEDLGGNSLAAVKLTTLMREVLQRDVPVTWLFEHPTIHALARRLAQAPAPTSAAKEPQSARTRGEGRQQALQRLGRRGNRGNE